MRLNSLELRNFRQHAFTRIDFDSGITGIIGDNGSGKTTILEAVAWALYGQSAARGTRDSIKHNRADSRAPVRVELDFELSGHRYRVVRGLTSAELYLDGAGEPIARSISSVTELVQRRLGMTRAEFFNTYFTGQKELNVMAAMGPTERAQFLSRVLGYEKLRSAQGFVRDRRKLIGAEAQGIVGGMQDPDSVSRAVADARERLHALVVRERDATASRAAADAAVELLAPRWERAQADRQRQQQLESELRVLESELAAARRDEARVRLELEEADGAAARHAELATLLAPLAALRKELVEQEELSREDGRRQQLGSSIAQLNEDLTRLAERAVKLDTAPELARTTQEQVEATREALRLAEVAAEEHRTVWVRDRQEAETRRDSLAQQWRELKAQRDRVAELGPESPCPTCTRPLGENLAGVLEMLDEQLDTVKVDGGYFKDRLGQLATAPEPVRESDEVRKARAAELANLERRLAKIQAALGERETLHKDIAEREARRAHAEKELAQLPVGYNAARHAARRAEVERLVPVEQEALRLAVQVDRAPRLRSELEQLAARLSASEVRDRELRGSLASTALEPAAYEALRTEMDAARVAAREAELTALQLVGELAGARQAVESAERDLREVERLQERVRKLDSDRRVHEELDRAFNDLRTDLNFQLRPELSDIASGFLADITAERYAELQLDDQYNVVVLEDGIPKPVISGGEEDMTNLVLRLAISQLIAERAGQSFSLLVLDEVFGSLDEAHRTSVVDLLRRLQDRFEQIILITHIESVREGVDRVVEVRYDAESGSSVVSRTDSDGELSGAVALAGVAGGYGDVEVAEE